MSDNDREHTIITADSDRQIREAFDDLSRRAATVPVTDGPHRTRAGGANRPPLHRPLVAVAAALVVAAVATVGLLQLRNDGTVSVATDGDRTITSENPTTDDQPSTDENPTTDDRSEPVTENGSSVEAGTRWRVDTDAATASLDPFVDVRVDAGATQPVLARLPSTYRGLTATGPVITIGDDTWMEVALLNPVAVDQPGLTATDRPTGWVDGDLVLPLVDGLAVGTDEVPACSGDHVLTASTDDGAFQVVGLESRMISDRCLRVVAVLAEGSSFPDWSQDPGPVGVPDVGVVDTPLGALVDLGGTGTAWPAATDTPDEAYIVRDGDEYLAHPECPTSCLDLLVPVPASEVTVTVLPDIGAVVVDLELIDPGRSAAESPVRLLGQPGIEADSVTVTGLARPFEATLMARIVDDRGEPVMARFVTEVGDEVETEEFAVRTTDWVSAWGRFIVAARGLPPGDYTMLLDESGGAAAGDAEDAGPDPTPVPFTIGGPEG